MALLDLLKFCRELPARRNKAALLLTPDLREQRACAAQIAGAAGATHFDVLDAFQVDGTLSERFASFSSVEFFALVAAQKAEPLLIVSGLEFLLAAWLSQDDQNEVKRRFCHQIEMWEGRHKQPFLLVTHRDPVFAAYTPARFTDGPLVIKLSQTLSFS
ncbi:MAG: hypothetical protein JO170_26920 [Verrucomicrobia bacterium]|nr:hypothetical protein [Verrucomicrobiota bacterium]